MIRAQLASHLPLVAAGFLLALTATLAPSCGVASSACGPSSCRGCCDAAGICQLGSLDAACGMAGGACSSCEVDLWCQAGSCASVVDTGRDGGAVTGLPHVLVLLDKSGSLHFPLDPTHPACPEGCGVTVGVPCPESCPVRLAPLKQAVSGLLRAHGSAARFGLATFPGEYATTADVCEVGALVHPLPHTDDPVALAAHAEELAATVDRLGDPGGLTVRGGTPTAGALASVLEGSGQALREGGRRGYVLLVTDGMPNCNPELDVNTCECSAIGYSPCRPDARNCVDQEAALLALDALRARGIPTLVVAFGPEISLPLAVGVFNRMAERGGAPRTCTQESDCEPGGLCEQQEPGTPSLCSVRFHPAGGFELGAVLERVLERLR